MVKIANIMFYIFYHNKKKFTKQNPRKFFLFFFVENKLIVKYTWLYKGPRTAKITLKRVTKLKNTTWSEDSH